MKKTICACLILSVCMSYTCASAQQQKKSSVVTYYPAPVADFKTVQMTPSDTAPENAMPGQIFYNSTEDKMQYFTNNTKTWESFGGSGNISNTYLPPKEVFPGTPIVGDLFYNNQTDTLQYYNKSGMWINLAADPYWAESAVKNATASDPYTHYNVYLNNHTLRRVGIGTNTPEAALHVLYAYPAASENPTVAGFYKVYGGIEGSDTYITETTEGSTVPSYGPYMWNSTMFYSCYEPLTALKFAALSPQGNINFNVGGYNNSNSEVMRLSNPGGESNPTPRVSIGNQSASMPFALFIDSGQNNTGIFGVRGVSSPVSAQKKSGYWNLAPDEGTTFNMNYGMWRDSFDIYLDRFWNGTAYNTEGSQIGICLDDGVELRTLTPGWYDASYMKNKPGWPVAKAIFNTTGYYQTSSSRSLKHNFVPVDNDEILKKIGQLDVTRWNYKADAPAVTHIGPVAEDFHRLFKTGGSEKELLLDEAAGVSLAGVKALSAKLNAQQIRIDRLETAIKTLKSKARP